MTYPLMLIVPINVSINKHVYGRIVGIDFGTQTIERLFCVSSLHCENATKDREVLFPLSVDLVLNYFQALCLGFICDCDRRLWQIRLLQRYF